MTPRRAVRIATGLALLVSAACDGSKQARRSCPDDERVHITSDLTVADVCAANGYTLIVRFEQPQTVEELLPLLEPLGATLACDDPRALAGMPGKTCYIVRLGSGLCCSQGASYFASLGSPRASTDVPHPETPCSCETHWTLQ